ncbi:protein kinase domain-containing protein [Thalassoroseus pseudoceratinae]|uniref:protein kinase domain-containing protein n=1 Tax=Thalassoroseus pseudoceratinae TaxID=2713176 RepID=UPI0014211D44|nr:protein kinase [Thalassoroseus pseudoceratinae]
MNNEQSVEECPKSHEVLAYLQGQLNDHVAVELEAHFADCDVCDSTIRQLDPLGNLLTASTDTNGFDFSDEPEYVALVNRCVAFGKPRSLTGFPQRLGRYRLLQELGRGAMGVVFAAEDISEEHDRESPSSIEPAYAVKVLWPNAMTDSRIAERFRRESKVAASLLHPGIVRVLICGEEDGFAYYAMERVIGCSIAEILLALNAPMQVDRQTLQLAEKLRSAFNPQAIAIGPAIDFMSQAAQALDYAHQQGIAHRDIKPANLLVDTTGRLRIADFGLVALGEESDLTKDGEILGTIRYLPPEQVRSKVRTSGSSHDIYSLALTFYEMIVGRPAYDGRSAADLLRRIQSGQMTPMHHVVPSLAPELNRIVCRASAKKQSRRFATAGEFADQLQKFDEQHPKVHSTLHRRFGRKVVWFFASIALMTLVAFSFTKLFPTEVSKRPQIAPNPAIVTTSSRENPTQRSLPPDSADEATNRVRYSSTIQHAGDAWRNGNLPRADRLLNEVSTEPNQSFAHRVLKRLVTDEVPVLYRHDGNVYHVAFSDCGRWLASASEDSSIVIWNRERHEISHRLKGHTDEVNCVAFSSNGNQLFSVSDDGTLRRWDVSTGLPLETLLELSQPISRVLVSPNNQVVLATTFTHDIRNMWIVRLDSETKHIADEYALSFSPDGSLALTSDSSSRVYVYHTDTWKRVASVALPSDPPIRAYFTDDNSTIAAVSRDQFSLIQNWRPADSDRVIEQHAVAKARAMTVLPYAGEVAICDERGNIFVHQMQTAALVASYSVHPTLIFHLAVAPDGDSIATAHADGAVRLHKRSQRSGVQFRQLPPKAFPTFAWYRPKHPSIDQSADDGSRFSTTPAHSALAFSTGDSKIRLSYAINEPANDKNLADVEIGVSCMTSTRDGSQLIVGTGTGQLKRINIDGSTRLLDKKAEKIFSGHILSDNGILTYTDDRAIELIHTTQGKLVRTNILPPSKRSVSSPLASYAGRIFFVEGGIIHCRFGDIWQQEATATLSGWVHDIACSPAGLLAAACDSGEIAVLDAKTLQLKQTIQIATGLPHVVAFSPDGRTLAVGCSTGSLNFFNVSTLHRELAIQTPITQFIDLGFSPESKTIAAAGRHGTHCWYLMTMDLRNSR